MNYDKLYSYTELKLFTDVSLNLYDANHHVVLYVHKGILSASCLYFEKLFTILKEKDLNSINIEVPNVYVAYDIIMSFYGQKTNLGNLSETRHSLESIMCCNFFGLDIDHSLLYDIEVSQEDFELLLNVIDLIGYDENTIKLINENLPKEYDLTKFPKELLVEMLQLAKTHYLVSGGNNNIEIWNPETGEVVQTLTGHTNCVTNVCCSLDGKYIASGSEDHSAKIWDTTTWKLVRTLQEKIPNYYNINHLCFSPNSKQIAFGSGNYIKIWDIQTADLINSFDNNDSPTSICFSPNGEQIASGGNQINVKIWDTKSGSLIHTLEGHAHYVMSLCYSPDSKYIVSGSCDWNIKIWDTETGNLICTLKGHNGMIRDLSYSSDGTRIISGSSEYCIKIWDSKTGFKIDTLYGHADYIKSVCYSPDNREIASLSQNGNIKIWNSQTGELLSDFNDDAKKHKLNYIRYLPKYSSKLEQYLTALIDKN